VIPWLANHPRFKNLAAYTSGVVACLAILVLVFQLQRADLRVPFLYSGDAVFIQALVKGIADHGWYLSNPSLGCPGSMEMQDFPMADNLHFFFLKLLTQCTGDSAVAFNLYFLATFPLTTLSTHLVMRKLGFDHGPAIVTSLLFTFLPFHFMRGENHLFLAAYFLIPPMMWVVLSLYLDRGLLFVYDDTQSKHVPTLTRTNTWAALSICATFASAGVYYAYFACVFLLVAGLATALFRKRFYPVAVSLMLIATVGLGTVATLAPELLYRWQNGPNPEFHRYWMESEIYGLKLSQLLLPIAGHRWKYLASLREMYDQGSLVNENSCASNGLIASIGFLFLLGRLVYRKRLQRPRPNLHDGLSILAVSGVLLATMGGVGTFVSLLGFHWIRAYNRISIYLAFLALVAVAALWQRFSTRYATCPARRVGMGVAAVLLLAIGIADQTTRRFIPRYADLKHRYQQDEEFFRRVEATCPPQGMIFQLPYLPFPEHPPPGGMGVYDHFRAYLHTTDVRWSYGAMKGRDADLWLREIADRPPEELVQMLAYAGYCGIYVNRMGYADQAAELEDVFTEILRTEPLVSADQTLLFFPLTPYTETLRERIREDDWRIKKDKTLFPVKARFDAGFSYPERQGSDSLRWCAPKATVTLENDLAFPRHVKLEMDCRVFGDGHAALQVAGPVASGEYVISSKSNPIVWKGTLPPGRHVLRLQCDGREFKTSFAPYRIALQVYNFSVKESD
jgi:hypothetical protein